MQSSLSFRSSSLVSSEQSTSNLESLLAVDWVPTNRAAIEAVLSNEVIDHGVPGAWFKQIDTRQNADTGELVAQLRFDNHIISVTRRQVEERLHILAA